MILRKLFSRRKLRNLEERSMDEIKRICKILFIDDKDFAVVEILKSSGWQNTRRIKDLSSIDDMELREADIVFCDIHGVGRKMQFAEQGLGMVMAIKEKYPSKKVIVYSSEDQGQIQAFHPGLNAADNRLSKLADPYQFQALVERYSKDIFSLGNVVSRLQDVLKREIGENISSEEILRALKVLKGKNDYSESSISKAFNIQNASSLVDIIQAFA